MKSSQKIVELMEISQADQGLDWLKESLQAAIELEFATLPPYLTALWSIKDESDPVYLSIRQHIAEEEMLHMGLACNMLTAIGGIPEINTDEVLPKYPGPLPGGVNPDLIVPLCALSRESVKIFLEIEKPNFDPVTTLSTDTFSTIGAFYDAIQDAFDTLNPPLSGDRQNGGWLGLFKIETLEQVKKAIDLIKLQGEGSEMSPEEKMGDLAHFYRFGEIYYGKKLRKDETTGEWRFDGDTVDFPIVRPMAEIPEEGYMKENVSDQVWTLLNDFDRAFTEMLNHLQDAWESEDPAALTNSVIAMGRMKNPAIDLMEIPIPSGNGNYGPCFRLVPSS